MTHQLFEPGRDFPNRLNAAHPSPLTRRVGWCLVGLMVLVIVPRCIVAMRLRAICDDGYYYISVGRDLEQRNFKKAFTYLSLNVYPVTLLGMHRLGFDWVTAGMVWGVLVSALTVLPLFGLVRRLYDDKVALAACFLFAMQPDLIETSIEPIRGPTFWFATVLSLYLSYRAVHRPSAKAYAWAGLAICLAIHTRSEGWLLFLPLALWSAYFWRRDRVGFRRRMQGLLLAGAVTPAMIAAVNCTLLSDHGRWEWGRLTPFLVCYDWITQRVSRDNVHVAGAQAEAAGRRQSSAPAKSAPQTAAPAAGQPQRAPDPAPAADAPPVQPALAAAQPPSSSPLQSRGTLFFDKLVRKFEPINSAFMLIGLIGWWRALLKWDKAVLTMVFAGLLLAVWIRLSQIGEINGRYFFTAYLIAIPSAGLGLLWSLSAISRLAVRLGASPQWAVRTAATTAMLLAGFYAWNAATVAHRQRDLQADLGEWLEARYGPFDSIVVDRGATRVGFFAGERMPDVSYFFGKNGSLLDEEAPQEPEVVVLAKKISPPVHVDFVYDRIRHLGLKRLDDAELPTGGTGFVVFVRPKREEATAAHPVARTRR